MTPRHYYAAIDSGNRSTGLAAVEVDASGMPTRILNAQTVVHDGGVDPGGQKAGTSRRAKSGAVRRARRLHKARKKRLAKLDAWIVGKGWPIVDLETVKDPYLPWKVRAELAAHPVAADELGEKLSIAARHIARHRGWRNPYSKVESLLVDAEPSKDFVVLRAEVARRIGRPLPAAATVGQTIAALSLTMTPLRKLAKIEKGRLEEGLLVPFKMMQSDHANELRTIARVQGIDNETRDDLIRLVFEAKSPRDHSAQPPAKDALPGQNGYRAPKAREEFQQFRIASVIANLRIVDGDTKRPLTVEERRRAFTFLNNATGEKAPKWDDVARVLGVDRKLLKGTATATADGDRASSAPPTNRTHAIFATCQIDAVRKWWLSASPQARAEFINDVSNSGFHSSEPAADAREEVDGLLEELSPADLSKLDDLSLPSGRAAYSVDSLLQLRDRILSTGDDLHSARKALFGVDDSWAPPAEPIGAPVGNPAVDRVAKIVARWLQAMEAEYGAPAKVVIENTRDGYVSTKRAKEMESRNNKRAKNNRKVEDQIRADRGDNSDVSFAARKRHIAVTRQNSQCGYCGSPIHAEADASGAGGTIAEIDHIVPRKGPGATNRASNLIAICKRCNRSKTNTPFAVWAQSCGIPGVSVDAAVERVQHWLDDPSLKNKAQNSHFKKSVIERLRRADFDKEDARSLESVSWMATELRYRIEQHYRSQHASTTVDTYTGSATAAARHASGLEGIIAMIGGPGKTRLDRRHHAVDAAVAAMLNPSVARTLAEREAIRSADRFKTFPTGEWKDYAGSTPKATETFALWKLHMTALGHLLNDALNADRIPVHQRLRLRLGNSGYHEETILPLHKKLVGDSFTPTDIDRAATPALWCALTRCPDYDPKKGLPEDPTRTIRLHDKHLGPTDVVESFSAAAAGVKARGGWAKIGKIHHARIYRIPGKKTSYAMLRVFSADLAPRRSENLFDVDLPPQAISMRYATKNLKDALARGTAEYVTWIVPGDELHIDISAFEKDKIGNFARAFPGTSHWRVSGFDSNAAIKLRPTQIALEGADTHLHKAQLPKEIDDAVREVLDRSWRTSVDGLIAAGKPTIVRRDALGRPRLSSHRGLPVCKKLQ